MLCCVIVSVVGEWLSVYMCVLGCLVVIDMVIVLLLVLRLSMVVCGSLLIVLSVVLMSSLVLGCGISMLGVMLNGWLKNLCILISCVMGLLVMWCVLSVW